MATKKKTTTSDQTTSSKTNVREISLSANKKRKIEIGFRITVNETRGNYLSHELEKYKNIKVSYD
ncbi:hypothetical protein [uncultured Marixanthomonas sp.]|uniref:hypothetical protein n=1 Tax=uncultured Marixanthomonas sp. TaxID=757245 RepID=UPI0030D7B9AB|tara:strand:- start:18983 stop:19177 length:195 start_codon:yes stop_codon:yes gene_type:complete